MLALRRAHNDGGLRKKKAPGGSGRPSIFSCCSNWKLNNEEERGQPFSALGPVVMDTGILEVKG